MGFFSDLKAAMDVQKIKNGGTASLSISQITCLIVNMPDAQKSLRPEQFQEVYALYKQLRTCRTKLKLDIEGYYETAVKIVIMFNKIAPYEKFSGGNELEARFLLDEISAIYGQSGS